MLKEIATLGMYAAVIFCLIFSGVAASKEKNEKSNWIWAAGIAAVVALFSYFVRR